MLANKSVLTSVAVSRSPSRLAILTSVNFFCVIRIDASFAPSAMSADSSARVRAWQSILSSLTYFSFFLMVAHGLSCDFENPCNLDSPSECASHIEDSCPHGYVLNACDCCACGKGPDETCGGQDNLEGVCGPGLVCVVRIPPDLPAYIDPSQLPGACKPVPTVTPESPTTPSQTSSPTSPESTDTPTDCDTEDDELSGSSSATQEILEGCRDKCSVEFCSENRHRLCSAQTLAYSRIQNRDSCQHTSCRSCYLLVDPSTPCNRCSEPPKKRCLRQYYECIKEQYLHTVTQILLPLDAPEAQTTPGRIICYVPEVEEGPPH